MAAALVEGGARVVVARGAAYEARRGGGVDVRTPTGARRVPVTVAASVREAAPTPDDLAVMGQHTAEAVAEVPPEVAVASLRNGVTPLDVLTRRGHPTLACMLWVTRPRG